MVSFVINIALSGAVLGVLYLASNKVDAPTSGAVMSIVTAIAAVVLVIRDKEVGDQRSWTSVNMTRRQKFIAVAVIVLMIAAIMVPSYFALTKQKERYTEFYILNQDYSGQYMPRYFQAGIEQWIVMGISNHEGRTINYTVEVWLVNYTYVNTALSVKQMFFYDRFNITLENVDVDINDPWVPQWQSPYPFNFTVTGDFYVVFMLFKDSPMPLPEPLPLDKTKNYSTTPIVAGRMDLCVNNQLLYLRTLASIT